MKLAESDTGDNEDNVLVTFHRPKHDLFLQEKEKAHLSVASSVIDDIDLIVCQWSLFLLNHAERQS